MNHLIYGNTSLDDDQLAQLLTTAYDAASIDEIVSASKAGGLSKAHVVASGRPIDDGVELLVQLPRTKPARENLVKLLGAIVRIFAYELEVIAGACLWDENSDQLRTFVCEPDGLPHELGVKQN